MIATIIKKDILFFILIDLKIKTADLVPNCKYVGADKNYYLHRLKFQDQVPGILLL